MKTLNRFRSLFLFLAALVICGLTARDFLAQRKPELIVAGPGVLKKHLLSDWFPALAGGRGDTPVYLLASDDSTQANGGADILILGGTHPNEPAAFIAAVLLVENIRVTQGRIWVIPQANASAFTQTEPQEAHPQFYDLSARDGSRRRFRMGSRLSNPLDQWPDPEITLHHPSGQALSGNETRNLNRCFPGDPQGTHTEKVAWGISSLIKKEQVKLLIDMHEASIEYPVINAIVSHERASDLAGMAVFGLSMEGLDFSLEPSPKNLHGLSHRELGDKFPELYATLMESANPIQGRLRGRTGVQQIISGQDACYHAAQKIGMNQVDYPETGFPLELRVLRHLYGCRELIAAYSLQHMDNGVIIENLPEKESLLNKGLSGFLLPAPAPGSH